MVKTISRPVLLCALAFLLLWESPVTAQNAEWSAIKAEEVAELNSDVKPGVATVDIGVYYPSNLDQAFRDQFSPDDLIAEIVKAKKIFADANVQLNLLWIKTGHVNESFLEIQSNDMSGAMPGGLYSNMYVNSRRHPSVLSPQARNAFESIIEERETSDRTVYLVVLQSVFMSFFEKLDERTWELRTITTGGLSFPSYIYQQIPRRLRGVITVNRSDPLRGIVAHELGHKLMNVSHEYKDIDPQHEVRDEGGLMLYGSGTDIPSGREGRWHLERLHLSPYIYIQSEQGVRSWNSDYAEGGHYYDPVYGDNVVHFENVPSKPAVTQ